jgi:hypothetical protein
MLGRWEWIIIELVVLGLLVAELISVRRSLNRDKNGQHPPPADPVS